MPFIKASRTISIRQVVSPDALKLDSRVVYSDASKEVAEAQRVHEVGPDLARLLGCIAIVWFHLGETSFKSAYFALPLFAVLSMVFIKPKSKREYVRIRFRRILVPWLIWSAIYGVFKTTECLIQNRHPLDWWEWRMVIMGTSLPLWFLPAIFVIGWLGVQISSLVGKLESPISIAAIGLVAILPLEHISELASTAPIPISQWISIIPATIMGTFAAAIRVYSKRDASNFLLFGGALLLIADQLSFTADLSTAIGILIVGACLSFPKIKWNQNWIVDCSFLVYLVHSLVGAVIKRMIHSGDRTDLLAVLTIVFSLAIAGAIYMSPFKRWLI